MGEGRRYLNLSSCSCRWSATKVLSPLQGETHQGPDTREHRDKASLFGRLGGG